ncbi:MAG TPA: adenylosuccinate lyase family protein [Solirubrobacteraceae bacterium]|nr:adenylosuccinate lyase family protein [Solirubrobacteraceae bacterium]
MTEQGLLTGLFSHGPVAAQTSEVALLQAMLDVEVALMRALAKAGIAPAQAANEVAQAADASTFDVAAIGKGTADQGTPVPAMLSALRARLSADAAAHLHQGATSQDIVDTALMLVAHRALAPLLDELGAATDACAQLAERHRSTLAPGRTLLQQALPLTFGIKAATWLSGLDASCAELADVRKRVLAVQFFGAVGTLAALGDRGLEVMSAVAEELGLAEPALGWHTVRLRPARLSAALGSALGVMGKVARDVVLLAQTEVAEAAEGAGEGRGASSTMPHKRNPVGAVAVIACAQRAPGLVATILGAMVQEHERAAGAWQAEWEPLLELLRLAGSAASTLRVLLEGLDVDAERMRADLDATGELVMSESVAAALSESIGRPAAQDLVAEAAAVSAREGRTFRTVLGDLPEVSEVLGADGLDAALDPRRYLGVSDELISRALAEHARLRQPA